MIPSMNGILFFIQAPHENSPVPPPPIGDEVEFNDGSYVQFNNGSIVEYNT